MALIFRLWVGACTCIALCTEGLHGHVSSVAAENDHDHNHHRHRHLQEEEGRGCLTPDPTVEEVQAAMVLQEAFLPSLQDSVQQKQQQQQQQQQQASSQDDNTTNGNEGTSWWQALLQFFISDNDDSDSDEVPVPSPASAVLAPGGPQPHSQPLNFKAVVPTYYHVIETSMTAAYIPDDDAVIAQHLFLDQAYAGSGLTFMLEGITRTTNESWYTAILNTAEEREMKEFLRMGGPETLNVYLNQPNGDNSTILGWASFPSWYQGNPLSDGVVSRASTVPGGPKVNFDLGYTVIHEVGHWLGLFHTVCRVFLFDASCFFVGRSKRN